MRATFRKHGLIFACSFLGILAGCGGGGGTSSGVLPSSQPPQVTAVISTAPVQEQYSEFNYYTFTATASDPNLGNTVASYAWNFGDGSAIQTTTLPQAAHAFNTSGSFTLNVTATDNKGNTSLAFTQPETVAATSNPFTITVNAPLAPVPLSILQGAASPVGYKFDFTITLNSASGFSYDVAGINFLTNDTLLDTVGAIQAGAAPNEWTVLVGFPPAAAPDNATGGRTFVPTLQVTDTTGAIVSAPLTLPAITITTTPSTAPPPVVTMNATPAIIVPGTTNTTYQNVPVTFTATATDTVISTMLYSWAFGDTGGLGDITSSTALTTAHTYASPGTYTVSFTADTQIPGGKKTIQMQISVLADTAPKLTVVTSPTTYYEGVPVTFTVTDSVSGQTPTYTWNFGDGTTGTGSPITHTFLASGSSQVTLVADDGKGGVTNWNNTLNILADVPPVVSAVTGPAGNLYQSKSYSFTATGTQSTSGYPIASFIWSWGDGSPAQTDSNVVAGANSTFTDTLKHSFPQGLAQTMNVTVQAVDSHGSMGPASPATAFPVVATSFPTPAFTAPAGASALTLPVGSQITVTYTVAVSNPNGAPNTYIPASSVLAYPLGAPSGSGVPVTAVVTGNGNGTYTFSYAYSAASVPGSVTINAAAQATDGLGIVGPMISGPAVTIVTVQAIQSPVVTMIATPAIVAGANATYQGVPVLFTATAVDPNGDILNESWTFSDGGKGDIAPTTASVLSQTHTFNSPGIYPVTFTASDTLPNGTNSVSLNIQVLADTAPVLNVSVSPISNYYVGVPVTFSVTDSTPNQTPVYVWNFGDGSPDGGGTPVTHTFQAAGQTLVSLSANDQKGGVTPWTSTLTILANTVPVAQAVQGPAGNLFQNRTYTFTATAKELQAGNTVTSYIWNWGDGSAPQVDSANIVASGANYTDTLTHVFPAGAASFNANITVQPVDNHGAVGVTSPNTSFPVINTTLPAGGFVNPTVPTNYYVETGNGSTVTVTFVVSATNPNGSGPLPASSVKVYPLGIAAGTTAAVTYTGIVSGLYTYSAVYAYPAASTPGTVSFTPTIQVTDLSGVVGTAVPGPVVSIQTINPAVAPSIIVTEPATGTTQTYSLQSPTLKFTLTDPVVNPVTYNVNWGDGSAVTTGTLSDNTLVTGDLVTLTHQYINATSSSVSCTVTITASDTRSAHQVATPQTLSFVVLPNALPTATINSPQGSGTLGFTPGQMSAINPSAMTSQLVVPPLANYPNIVVIPAGGVLTFKGTTSPSTSGEAIANSSWTFPNGNPSSFSGNGPIEVTFAGVPGQMVANLVEFQATDVFGRSSDQSGVLPGGQPLTAPSANTTPFSIWVVVDGINTQDFTLTFLYRQKSDNNGVATLVPVQTAANGLGASVQIFQDGLQSTWAVQSANQASVTIPVRSNLPFNALIPSFGADSLSYTLQIPNSPIGAYQDPSLETTTNPLPVDTEGFGFQYPTATSGPWNPILQVVTGQGFAAENTAANARVLIGTVSLALDPGLTPLNSKWVDRLSVPLIATGSGVQSAIQWEQDTNLIYTITNIEAYQSFAEWPTAILTEAAGSVDTTDVNSTVQGKPADMGFNVNYSNYAADGKTSQTFMATEMQAFRAPSGSTDPYNLSDINGVGWGRASCVSALNPTTLTYSPNGPADYTVPSFYQNMVYGSAGTAPLAGGLQGLSIPYSPNDPNRTPLLSPSTRNFNPTRSVFAYSEYLWSSVWVRPLVLNSAQLNYSDTEAIYTDINNVPSGFTHFRFSQPAAWPSYLANPGIIPDNSNFNLAAVGGPSFDASFPVEVNSSTAPSHTGVGRFYWTAFTPSYNADTGAVISRTWLGLDSSTSSLNDKPPTVFSNTGAGDATSAFGLVPPQDTVVDKRGRNADGSLNGQTLGGYRVTWFNATVDLNGNPVPPDFWVVELATQATNSNSTPSTIHFMLPSNYPAVSASPSQAATALVLTDARTYLPSGNTPAQGPATSNGVVTDLVAPGYCWFDVPLELRPLAGTEAQLTVFGLKSILKNNAVTAARALYRTDWIDAIKTATAQISVIPSSGLNISYAHKIPFNYPWDIVVVNGPSTTVAP